MRNDRTWKIGDRFYRFEVNLAEETSRMDIFEVTDTAFGGRSVTVTCVDDKYRKYMQGVYFHPGNELGRLKTNGSSKYVLMEDDDPKGALETVCLYLHEKKEQAWAKYEELSRKTDVAEKLLSEAGNDDLREESSC